MHYEPSIISDVSNAACCPVFVLHGRQDELGICLRAHVSATFSYVHQETS